MSKEHCSQCGKELVSGEKIRCVYCELNQVNVRLALKPEDTTSDPSTHHQDQEDVYRTKILTRVGHSTKREIPEEQSDQSSLSTDTKCGKCNLFTIRDKESLHCELCKLWYHNGCNEVALDDQYCSLVFEAPKNIKWFCDKCVCETEKWITHGENSIIPSYKKPKRNISRNSKANLKRKKGRTNGTTKKAKTSKRKLKQNCEKCPKIFFDEQCFEAHLLWHDGDMKPFKCLECEDKGFSTKGKLREHHLTMHLNEEDHSQDHDGFDYNSGDDDEFIHTRKKNSKRGEIKHSCDKCPKVFYDTQIYEAHMLWHTGDKKPYKCLECGKGCITKRKLRDHSEMHANKRKFICEICGKGYNGADLLKRHVAGVHSKVKPYSCPKCELRFKRINHFAKHMQICEGAETKCTLCDYKTKRRWTMKIHMRTHSGEKNYACDECGVRLKTLDGLKIHRATHSFDKPLKCEVCGKGFKHKPNLRVHMAVHTKVKEFFCPVCGSGFASKDRLDNHLKFVHTDEKPFECEVCGNKYKTNGNLRLHQRGIRGTCHETNNHGHKQAIKSQRKPKPPTQNIVQNIAQNIANDSNSSNPVPVNYAQYNQQPPPLMVYTGGNNQPMAPVYSRSHVTATIHCPPPALSVFTGHYMGQINNL